MAGEEGFEPPNDGSKGRCLTTWRLPIAQSKYTTLHQMCEYSSFLPFPISSVLMSKECTLTNMVILMALLSRFENPSRKFNMIIQY